MIGKVVQHLEDCKAKGTLIVPHWPKQVWWNKVAPDGVTWASFVKQAVLLPGSSCLFRPGPGLANTKGVGRPWWKVYALRVDFQDS